jgi:hypothetical protein
MPSFGSLPSYRDPVHELDHCIPAAAHAKLGTTLNDVITSINAICAKFDAGPLGTNNVATIGIKTLLQRLS